MQRVSTNWVVQQLVDTDFLITTFGLDETGNLYVSDYLNGKVYHLADSDDQISGSASRT